MIAITGADGFLGKHCRIYCKIKNIKNVVFINKKNHKKTEIINKLKICKVFIHLAGINRIKNGKIIKKNLDILNYYLDILEHNKNLEKIIFTSSVHKIKNNDYGKSKLQSEEILKNFCYSKKTSLRIITLSNIFGEFCKPNYNSVTATFCNNLIINKKIKIKKNNKINLVYVKDAVENIFSNLKKNKSISKDKYTLISVKNLQDKLYKFKEDYFNNIIPKFKNNFEVNLFNTFRSYAFPKKIVLKSKVRSDNRGSLWEIIKSKKSSHLFISTTNKGKIRGNHFHTKKIERFIILHGSAVIKFRHILDKKIYKFTINSKQKCSIDIPTYCTHSLTNKLNEKLITLFYTNEIYDPKKTDTYYEKV